MPYGFWWADGIVRGGWHYWDPCIMPCVFRRTDYPSYRTRKVRCVGSPDRHELDRSSARTCIVRCEGCHDATNRTVRLRTHEGTEHRQSRTPRTRSPSARTCKARCVRVPIVLSAPNQTIRPPELARHSAPVEPSKPNLTVRPPEPTRHGAWAVLAVLSAPNQNVCTPEPARQGARAVLTTTNRTI